MKKTYTFVYVTLLCITLNSFAVNQSSFNDSLYKVNNQMGVTVSGKYFKYAEPSVMKDSETLPGGYIFINTAIQKFYSSADLSFHTGTSKYDGALTPSNEPYSTKQDSSLFNSNVKLGYIIYDAETTQIIPYLGIGFDTYRAHSKKDVSNNGSLVPEQTRITTNGRYFLGAICNIAINDDLVISPELAIGRTFSGKVAYGKCANSSNDCYDFDLNYGIYYNLALKANYFINDNVSINSSINYKHMRFGKSSNKQHNFVYTTSSMMLYEMQEPKSKTDDLSFGLGLSSHF